MAPPAGQTTNLYGLERATRAFIDWSLQAVRGLRALVEQREMACRCHAEVPLSRGGTTAAHALMKEHELRARAGLPGHFLDYRTLRRGCGIDREAALLSPGAADADPYVSPTG